MSLLLKLSTLAAIACLREKMAPGAELTTMPPVTGRCLVTVNSPTVCSYLRDRLALSFKWLNGDAEVIE